MSYRHSLGSFSSARETVAAIDDLYKAYRAVFKRNATVELFYSQTSTPDAENARFSRDSFNITLYANDPIAQRGEIEWFEAAVSTTNA